jgi:hypothetical protein
MAVEAGRGGEMAVEAGRGGETAVEGMLRIRRGQDCGWGGG